MCTQQTTWHYRVDRGSRSSQQVGQAVEIRCIHSEFQARKLTVCRWRSRGSTGRAEEVLEEDFKNEIMEVGISMTSGA